MNTLDDLLAEGVSGRTVLVRSDLNVPLDGLRITDDGRIRASVPTLSTLREAGARVVLTDFQMFNVSHLESAETLLMALAQTIAEWLDLAVSPAEVWDPRRGPNPNFRR